MSLRNGYPEERIPMNYREQEVVIQRKKLCRVTTTQCILILCLIFLLLAIILCLAGYIFLKKCAEPNSQPLEPNATYLPTKPALSTVPPNLPWSNIRLPPNLVPDYYRLHLRIDVKKFEFRGNVTINVQCQFETSYVVLHSNSLEIDKKSVAVFTKERERTERRAIGIDSQFYIKQNQFYVLSLSETLRSKSEYIIVFSKFEGTIMDDLRGLYKSSYKDKEGRTKYLVASQLQAVDARKVFPCFDEPHLKAIFKISIEHDPGFIALSNMHVHRSITLPNGWLIDVFHKTPIMSTYILGFVVCDFRERDGSFNGLRIRIWAQKDKHEQTAHALNFSIKTYQYFTEYFNQPEKVIKADHVAIPDFSAGAMENWGLVLYRETALLHDHKKSPITNKYFVSLVMAHEIAHTWFGNMVTMKWWDDLWLNEGFCNTLMYFALDTIYPDWKVNDQQLVSNVFPVMTKDSLLTSHAISAPIERPEDIPQFFDSISYDKGMAVLRLLRGFLPPHHFQQALQSYVSTYRYKNAEMSQLWATFAKVSKHNVAAIMDTWTRQMGLPVVTVKRLTNGSFLLEQKRFLLNPDDEFDPNESPFKYKWIIPFYYRLHRSRNKTVVWMNRTSAILEAGRSKWFVGNADFNGFFRTNYDLKTWKYLIEELKKNHKSIPVANRAGLINDAFNLARANQLSYEVALNLSTYIIKEDELVPWQAFLNEMTFLKNMLSTSDSYGLLTKYLTRLVIPKYREGKEEEQGLLKQSLRRLISETAADLNVPPAVNLAKERFESYRKWGTYVNPNNAIVVYSQGIKLGGQEEWDMLWNNSRKTNIVSEADIMMQALAHSQEPWILWRYARWTLDPTKIRMQDVRNVFQYFTCTPLVRSVAFRFLVTNWKTINEKFQEDVFLLRDVIYSTTASINTQYEYGQLERLYKRHPPAGVASKAAENSLSLIRSNIKWMETNHVTIKKWLERDSNVSR